MDAPSDCEARQPKLVMENVFCTVGCNGGLWRCEKNERSPQLVKCSQLLCLPLRLFLLYLFALFRHALLELILVLGQPPCQSLITKRQNLHCKHSRVGRTGVSYSHCGDRNAGWHLHC